MIFLLFGGGTRVKELGDGESRLCARCHNTTTWTRLRVWHVFTFFFIPIVRWGRREIEACPVCGEAVDAGLPSPRSPWWTRRLTSRPVTH